MSLETLEMSLPALEAAYRDGLEPRTLWKEFLRRLAAWDDPALFLSLAGEADLEGIFRRLAEPGARKLPLFGIPFAVKDNIDWDALPTTAGCPAFRHRPTRSAAAVERLLAAGAFPVGKTNLDQFATGLVGTRSPYGVPRNALNPGWIPGGSSSGSASAVAAGLVAFSLGTDTAGSGRVPAAFQGLVGYKPTRGLVSTRGVVPACRTLDCVSVFAGTVEEARRIGGVLEGFDGEDPYSRQVPASRTTRPRRPVVGVPRDDQREFFGAPSYAAAFEASLKTLAARGAEVVALDLSALLEAGSLLYQGPWVAERLAAVQDLWSRDPEAFHPVTRKVLETAAGRSAVEAFQAGYSLENLRRRSQSLWPQLDALMLPTAPFLPTLAEVEADPLGVNTKLGTWTNFVNLLDLAALAVPAGLDASGRPFGVTFLGPAGSDQALFEMGLLWETPGNAPPRTLGRTILAVAGAHMRGLPLNGQLTSRGARFIEETFTAPSYRLFTFRDGALDKPGLVRSPQGGASLSLELWDLPEAAWGGFQALIPHPLGLSQIELATGEWVTGFVMEASHIPRCTEITLHGSWRTYLSGVSR